MYPSEATVMSPFTVRSILLKLFVAALRMWIAPTAAPPCTVRLPFSTSGALGLSIHWPLPTTCSVAAVSAMSSVPPSSRMPQEVRSAESADEPEMDARPFGSESVVPSGTRSTPFAPKTISSNVHVSPATMGVVRSLVG